jgi:hypothetical protein
MYHPSNAPTQRLAWLTPLSGQHTTPGGWLITHHLTQMTTITSEEHRRITASSLLQLMSGVLQIPRQSSDTSVPLYWASDCRRYTATWQRGDNLTRRLFVQRAGDYFARIELIVDGVLVAAFQEPVWPHLQKPAENAVDRLLLPADCLAALEIASMHSQHYAGYALPRFNEAVA